MVDRVVDTIARWGTQGGYFASAEDAAVFADELRYLMVHQHASFNSPVWFNIGVPGTRQQASACFILSVEDSMDSILDWFKTEGVIFKGGSGSGINVSTIRSSKEHLSGGGLASGPVSFMRGADSVAGSIKSGGTTRRAAKMVVLNSDHPDVRDFIWCKAKEEKKAWALGEQGYDMGLNGEAWQSIQFQNANNSVRATDDFMRAALAGEAWPLKAVGTCTSMIRRATSRASTSCASSTRTASSTSSDSSARSTSSSPPRRSWSASPTTRRQRSRATPRPCARSAWATRTSAHCS
jgi:ribonucleoside-diphosphate reductase alpha chain